MMNASDLASWLITILQKIKINTMCLAIPGKILSISNESDKTFRMGKVSFGGITKEVNLSMVKEAALGDYVLVHAGVAISKIDEEEAKITLEYLKQIGEMDELENKPD